MNKKCLGIWMDHSSAHLMEIINAEITSQIIDAKHSQNGKGDTMHTAEKSMNNRSQHEGLAYYKSIAEVIKPFQEVLIFGPTDAKNELVNLMKSDHHFDKINITTRSAEKMSENQQQAFVKEYFLNL